MYRKSKHIANDGTTKDIENPNPRIHTTHTIPYWLSQLPPRQPLPHTAMTSQNNTHTFINKEHTKREPALTQYKFTYVNKWLTNEQIIHKLSNFFWKVTEIIKAQITRNTQIPICTIHRQNNWSLTHTNPNNTMIKKHVATPSENGYYHARAIT